MILANYTQENRNAARVFGMGFTNPLGQFRPTLFPSFYTPNTVMDGLDKSAFNNGYNTHSAWHLSPKSGGIGSVNSASGTGGISASALAVKLAEASLTGDGDLTAIGSLIVQALASLTGSGQISSANLQAFLAAVASLTGTGTIAGPLTGLAELLATLIGSGTTTATLPAVGQLAAALTVTGTGLSTANVGEAVWGKILEAGFTAEEIMRLLASVAAGDASGLEGATPVFRDLADTKDRIIATYSGGAREVTSVDVS